MHYVIFLKKVILIINGRDEWLDKYKDLQYAIDEITEIAKGYGLDFYPMRYEICPPEIIYTFGAYGMPTRFTHWSFGKQFHKMKLHYDLGLSKIYELVINSDPCYAFLLNSNSLVQNKMIIAHVLAHSDFFKNNQYFSHTRKDMVESMAKTSEQITKYEQIYGKDQVEQVLDAVLSIQEHIDPSVITAQPMPKEDIHEHVYLHRNDYSDLWQIDGTFDTKTETQTKKEKGTIENNKDILLFIAEHSRFLDDWQRDIIMLLREEMLYFWPQLITKIMNEGWASYWHQTIMRDLPLSEEETIEFAKLHAGVIQPSTTSINPYYLGLKLLEDIEERYNHPTKEWKERGIKPNSGRDTLFDIREMESDISFIRNYMTKDFMTREDMYLFEKKGEHYVISDQAYKEVKQQFVHQLVNGGFPTIHIKDADYLRNGELYLHHQFEGMELDIPYLEKVLIYIYTLWGRTVHLETIVEEKSTVFSYDGNKQFKRAIYH